jgi:lysine/ornithine N-monooxygenase
MLGALRYDRTSLTTVEQVSCQKKGNSPGCENYPHTDQGKEIHFELSTEKLLYKQAHKKTVREVLSYLYTDMLSSSYPHLRVGTNCAVKNRPRKECQPVCL